MKHTAPWLLYLAAFLWPWDCFQWLPGIPISLALLTGIALTLLACHDLKSGARLRLPFDLLWPLATLALFTLITFFLRPLDTSLHALPLVLLYAAALQLLNSRATILTCLFLTVLSSGGVAILSMLAQAGVLLPTAVDTLSGTALLPAGNVIDGAATLLIGALTALFFLHPDAGPPPWRIAAPIAAFFCGAVLLYFFARTFQPPGPSLTPLPLAPAALLPGALLFWLLARLAAKLIVGHLEDPPGRYLPLLALLAAWTLALLLWGGAELPWIGARHPFRPRFGEVFTAALLTAYALPDTRPDQPPQRLPRAAWAAIAPLLLLAAFHLIHPSPNLPGDSRRYQEETQRLYRERAFGELYFHLDFWTPRVPGDPRLPLYRAKARLAQGNFQDAATRFCALLKRDEATALTEAEINTFLDQLRDHCSALPVEERGLAYEKALVAAGRANNALTSLEIRLSKLRQPTETPAEPLANELAALLGDPALAHALQQWEASALQEILVQSGIRPAQIP